MKKDYLASPLVAAGVIAVVTIAFFTTELSWSVSRKDPAAYEAASVALARTGSADRAFAGFSRIVDKSGPAVVNISVIGERTPELSQLDPDDPAYEFFKRFGQVIPRQPVPVRGQGSGFIISRDGLVLTNAHVVDGASEVDVKLTDKRVFRAKVLGADKYSDVAVIKIEGHNLPTVKLGDPAGTRPGDWVVAIGSPFGFENTVTAGIVSAKQRRLPDETYVPFIQTDVPLNPGNSGGPLFNLQGQVIGINSQIFSGTGGYMGLSFAVPIDVAMKAERQLVAHGEVTRGRIGVAVQEVDQALADSFGLPKPDGALVSAVQPNGPAAEAGLQPGDVIVKMNGMPIAGSADLPTLVADAKPGSHATLEIVRKAHIKQLAVTIGSVQPLELAGDVQQGGLGLTVRPLAPGEQREARAEGGLLVENVGGQAARAGIQPGDVILQVDGTPVRSVEELRTLTHRSGKHVALLVQRQDARIFVPVDVG